jgi:hypothetical protein
MREIKFRAWDGKKMNDVLCVDFDGVYIRKGEPSAILKENDGCWPLDVLVLEQCTGLKDINGGEIYEGDLLINEPETSPFYKVIYVLGMFCFQNDKMTHERPVHQVCHFMKIIGNIHENPELLK